MTASNLDIEQVRRQYEVARQDAAPMSRSLARATGWRC